MREITRTQYAVQWYSVQDLVVLTVVLKFENTVSDEYLAIDGIPEARHVC